MKKLVKKSAPKTVVAMKNCTCKIKCYIQYGFTSISKSAMTTAQNQMNRYN